MLPIVVRVEDLDKKASVQHVFRDSPVHIGRNNLCDLSLAYPFVSLWHGMLRFDQAAIEYVDLNSTNGSEVDGQRVKKNVFVPVGERTDLRIGSLRLHIARGGEATAPEAPRNQTIFNMRKSVLGPRIPSAVSGPAAGEAAATVFDSAALGSKVAEAAAAAAPSPRHPTVEKATPRPAPPQEDRSRAISDELFPLYVKYRQDWRILLDSLIEKLATAPPEQKSSIVEALTGRMSALRQEEQFRSLAARVGLQLTPAKLSNLGQATLYNHSPDLGRAADSAMVGPAIPQQIPAQRSRSPVPGERAEEPPVPSEVGGVALSLLRLFAQTYGSDEQALRSPTEVELLFNQMAAVLETFSKGFVELRRGVDQFVEEMAVQVATTLTPLRKAETAAEVLRHLLDADSEGESAARIQSLNGGFAHVMIHQVALLSGIKEGIRALLTRLSPEQLERSHSGDVAVIGNIAAAGRLAARFIARKLWPFRVFTLWRQYLRRYAELAEEERQLQSVVFGPEFAHAYLLMVSGRPPPDSNGDGSRRPSPRQ